MCTEQTGSCTRFVARTWTRRAWRGAYGAVATLGLLSLMQPASAAIVTQRVDAAAGAATIDGALGTDEYGPGNSYNYAGGGTGFGGVLNGANRVFMNSDGTNLNIAFSPGAALNDFAVMYLDTRAGGFTDATMSDTGDAGRNVVTNLGAAGNDGFPARNGTASEADFALLISQFGCTMFELTGGSLNVVSTTASCAADTGASLREVSVPLASLGSTAGGPIDFFMAYCSSTLFNSNETVPPIAAINGGANPGFDASVNYVDCHRFYSFAGGTPQMVISQVYGAGGNNFAMYLSDYVELHNRGTGTAALTNWSVQYASSTGTTWTVTTIASAAVPPGGYLLVKQADGTSLPAPQSFTLPTPDFSGTTSMAAGEFKVALCNSTTALTGAPACPFTAAIVDFVGVGPGATSREPCTGTAVQNAPAGSAAHAVYRNGCGGTDSNTNNLDFANGFVSPRNSLSAPNGGLSAIGHASPYFAEAGRTVRIVVTPRACGGGALPSGTTVQIDLTAIGGSATQALVDNGTSGDEAAGDGIFSFSATIGASVTTGAKIMPFTVAGGGNSGGGYIPVQVLAAATPDNDNCAGAQDIPGPYTTPVDVSSTFTGASAEYNPITSLATAPTTGMSARRGLWYTVTGTGNTMTASLCPTTPTLDTVCIVMCGTCDGLTVVGNSDDAGATLCPASTAAAVASWCSAPGQVYYVWVAPFGTGASTAAFTLRISDGAACTTAVACTTCTLTPGSGAVVEQEAGHGTHVNDGCESSPNLFSDVTLVGTTPLNIAGTARGYGDSRDVDWYRFQAASTDILAVSVTAQFNAVVSIRQLSPTGTCTGATTLTTSASSARCGVISTSSTVTAGNWYAVRIIHAPTPTQFGGVAVSASSYNYIGTLQLGAPPANDNCATAQTLSFGTSYTAGSTLNATNDGAASCDPGGVTSRDVWYSVTSTVSGAISVDSCTSATDTAVSIYSGACGALTEVACNDDCGGTPCGATASCLVTGILPAGTYRIRVSDKGLGASGGPFSIRAIFTPVPANDNCTSPATLSFSTSYTAGTTLLASTDGTSSCDATGRDVWYRITPGGLGTLSIDTCTSTTDTVVTLYSGACGSLTELACNDDCGGAPCGATSSCLVVPSLAPGTYLIRVSDKGLGSGGPFNVRATFAPVNDLCADAIPIVCGQTLTGTVSGATADSPPAPATCPDTTEGGTATVAPRTGVWYRLAGTGGIVRLSTCDAGTNFDTQIIVYAAGSTCASLTCYVADDDTIGAAPDICALSTLRSIVRVPTTAGAEYLVLVTPFSAGTSGNFTLIADSIPAAITTPPANQTACVGQSATFTVTATGAATYQWRVGGVDIVGATGSSYTIAAVTLADAGSYDVVVSNGCGQSVTSAAATLTVNEPVSITAQPDSTSACVGASASFAVVATGTAPLSYQWKKDDVDIVGATSDTYAIPAVALTDGGSYTVVVTNACGSVTSDAAVLTIGTGKLITDQPDSTSACVGAPASFSVVATGTAPLSYQWKKDGVDILGATSDTYTIAAVAESDAGSYTVVVTNPCGSATTDAAVLTIGLGKAITDQPDSVAVCDGDPASFSVVATGTAPLSYQWKKDGTDILGATSATYSIAAVTPTDAGSYTVVVSNPCGSVTSDAAVLSLLAEPTAPTGAASDRALVCAGYTGDVTLTATGGAGGTLTWYAGGCGSGTAIGTGASLTIPAPGSTTTYYVRVEGACGVTDCASVTVTRSTAIRGDSDGSGGVDFNDINCFVSALISPEAWQGCGTLLAAGDYICANDANGDGSVDFNDISDFVTCLVGSGCP